MVTLLQYLAPAPAPALARKVENRRRKFDCMQIAIWLL
jgi:hypothetical protein